MLNMKSCVLLIAFVLAIAEVQSTILEELAQTDQKCRAESNISEEDIKELFSLKITGPAKCYLKCFLESEGYWKNSQLNKEYIMDIVGKFKILQKFEGIVVTVLDQCQDVKAANDCDAAYDAVKCVVISGIKTVGGGIGDLLFSGVSGK